jgi:hypothetical protein
MPWQYRYWVPQLRKELSENAILNIYWFSRKSFTHFYRKGLRLGVAEGSLTEKLKKLEETEFRFVPLVRLTEVSALARLRRKDAYLLLTRGFGIPAFPVAVSDRAVWWFILPTKGFQLFLQSRKVEVTKVLTNFWIEISEFPDDYQRKLLARCAANEVRWRKFGGHIFVPLGAIFSEVTQDVVDLHQIGPSRLHDERRFVALNLFRAEVDIVLDVVDEINMSVDTIVKKGFNFMKRKVAELMTAEVSDEDMMHRDEAVIEVGELKKHELLTQLFKLNFSNLSWIEEISMYCEHICGQVFGENERYFSAYVRMVANTQSMLHPYCIREPKMISRFEDGDPSVRLLIFARQQLCSRIYRRHVIHAYRVDVYRQRTMPADLLKKHVGHAIKCIIDKFERLWSDESCSKVGVGIYFKESHMSVRVPVPRETFEAMMERVANYIETKWNKDATVTLARTVTKSFIKWFVETFGVGGFKVLVGSAYDGTVKRVVEALNIVRTKIDDSLRHFIELAEMMLMLPQTVPR